MLFCLYWTTEQVTPTGEIVVKDTPIEDFLRPAFEEECVNE